MKPLLWSKTGWEESWEDTGAGQRPAGKPFRRPVLPRRQMEVFFWVLWLQTGVSYQTFSFSSSLHLSYPSHCIHQPLTQAASDSTCICCATFLPHFGERSFYSLCLLSIPPPISFSSVDLLHIRNALIHECRLFMKKCGPSPLFGGKHCSGYFHNW